MRRPAYFSPSRRRPPASSQAKKREPRRAPAAAGGSTSSGDHGGGALGVDGQRGARLRVQAARGRGRAGRGRRRWRARRTAMPTSSAGPPRAQAVGERARAQQRRPAPIAMPASAAGQPAGASSARARAANGRAASAAADGHEEPGLLEEREGGAVEVDADVGAGQRAGDERRAGTAGRRPRGRARAPWRYVEDEVHGRYRQAYDGRDRAALSPRAQAPDRRATSSATRRSSPRARRS